jgi:branched-chain amino acid transport system permease protein
MNQLPAVIIDGILYASWMFIIAVGLTLVYGVMKILNVAHGSLYALGAYTACKFVAYWLGAGHAPMSSYGALLLAAIVVGLVAGLVIERGLLQFMYGREEIVLVLVTYALFLILEDASKLMFGVDSLNVPQPSELLGNLQLGRLVYPVYNVLLVVVAIVVGLGLTLVINRTRQGKILRAVIHDREMSMAMGVNVSRVYMVTFTVGATLAALGGALTAPTTSVQLGIGADVRDGRDRRPGQPRRCGARRLDRRPGALRGGPLRTGGGAVQHLRGDGNGAHHSTQRSVRCT